MRKIGGTGAKPSDVVQINHPVALGDAWQTGAQALNGLETLMPRRRTIRSSTGMSAVSRSQRGAISNLIPV